MTTQPTPVDVEHFRPLRLSDLWSAFARYKFSAVVVAILLLPILVVAVWLIPAQFDSYAQLLIRLGRGAVSMDPTANLSPTVSLQDSRSSQVNSVKEMLQSRVMAQRVVNEVGADRILEPRSLLSQWTNKAMGLLPEKTPKPLGEMSAEEVENQIKEEMATVAFQEMMNLNVGQDAYTISLEVRTEDPFLSQELLSTLIQVYQTHHAEAHNSKGSLEFFRKQADVAYKRAMGAKEAFRAAKTERGIIDVYSSKDALQALISQVESDLIQTENDLASTTSEIERLVSDINEAPRVVETEVIRGIPKATGNTMRQSLYDLEVRYNEQAVKLSPDHPKLRALREQLDAASKIASDERGDQPQSREAINPIRQQLEISHVQNLAKLAGLQSKHEKLIGKLGQLQDDLQQINQDEVDLTELNWETDLAEQEYLRAAENRDNAKLIEQLASGQVSEIAVVQDATLGLKKVKPRRGILAILAAMLACSLGVFQALIRGLLVAEQESELSENTQNRRPPVKRPEQLDPDATIDPDTDFHRGPREAPLPQEVVASNSMDGTVDLRESETMTGLPR